jgi:hypothetical protein
VLLRVQSNLHITLAEEGLAILSCGLVVTGKVWFSDWRSMTHAREDNLAGSKIWLASTVTKGLVKETHWFSKLCGARPDNMAEEGVYFGELLLRGCGQAKGNQSCNLLALGNLCGFPVRDQGLLEDLLV